jgi:hypothetical protein
MPWRAPRTLRDGHLDRDTIRARSAMAINQAELSAISQLERQQDVYDLPYLICTASERPVISSDAETTSK